MNNEAAIPQQNNLNKLQGAVVSQYPPKLVNYPSTPNVLQIPKSSPSQPQLF